MPSEQSTLREMCIDPFDLCELIDIAKDVRDAMGKEKIDSEVIAAIRNGVEGKE